MGQNYSWVLTGPQLDKKFHACYGNKCFITASQDPVTCPCPKPHQVRPYPSTSLLILILSHLCLCLPSDLFPQVSPLKPCMNLSSPVYYLVLLGPDVFLSTLLSNTLSLCFSLDVRPSFTPVQNISQNYSSIYFNFYIFGYQPGRKKVLHALIGSTAWLQSPLNFFTNKVYSSEILTSDILLCWFFFSLNFSSLFHYQHVRDYFRPK